MEAVDVRPHVPSDESDLGIPVEVGISTTKSLTKLANWASKKWKTKTGTVVDLVDPVKQEKLLRFADVGEIWGIGRQLKNRLQLMGINKGWDLATFDKKTVRRHFNIKVGKTSRELAGEYCHELTEDVTPKQMIACTRSFSQRVTPLDGLAQQSLRLLQTLQGNCGRKTSTRLACKYSCERALSIRMVCLMRDQSAFHWRIQASTRVT